MNRRRLEAETTTAGGASHRTGRLKKGQPGGRHNRALRALTCVAFRACPNKWVRVPVTYATGKDLSASGLDAHQNRPGPKCPDLRANNTNPPWGSEAPSTARVLRLTILCLLVAATPIRAEAPQITRITPTGAQLGATTELKLTGKPNGELKAWSDCEELTFEFSKKFDSVKVTASKDAIPGQWWLRFYNDDGTSQLLKLFVSGLPEVVEAEPNDTPKKPQLLTGSSVVTGVLAKSGDADIYVIALKKDQTFIAQMNAHRMGSPMDGVLQLLDERGTVLTQNDEGLGFDPQIVFDIPRDGTYMVRTFAFPAAPNSTIRFAGASTYVYRLKLTTGPVISHTLPMLASSEKPSEVKLFGWNLTANSATTFETWNQQTRRVRTGSASLELPLSTGVCETEPERLLDAPISVSGTIAQRGETDTIRFKARKSRVELHVTALSAYSKLDPVVAVKTKAGKLIKEFDDISRTNRDIKASFNLSADGEYIAEIRDRFGHSGPRHTYGLRLGKPAPAFAATVTTDSFTTSAGKPLEIPITIDRSHGFAEPIEFRLIGAPDGVSGEPVTSEPKGATAKAVKLLVKASGKGAGPFRIQAVTGSNKAFVASPVGVADLWVTAK